MPETAMNEYYSFVFGKNYIRASGKLLYIFTITKTSGEQVLPHQLLWLGSLAPYAGHIIASYFRSVIISHSVHRAKYSIKTIKCRTAESACSVRKPSSNLRGNTVFPDDVQRALSCCRQLFLNREHGIHRLQTVSAGQSY